jgi:large subunit ribosomal protein L4e
MAARPQVTVFSAEGEAAGTAVLPAVFTAPIRSDVVQFVHTSMSKNKRQARAVYKMAGHETPAESWGTGRAVARIPRVPGGGTSRSGQAAFGNMCRGGRMFAPTKVWRRWHRRINKNQRRFAQVSALAASALPALVMARGHKVSQVAEVPCVVDDSIESLSKTRDAVTLLKKIGAYDDVEKAKNSKTLRAGKGKLRNRRHVMRRGPLVVYGKNDGIFKAFRNLPGVDVASVTALNLLDLAPGGHVGRFVVFSKSAFEQLDDVYGTFRKESKTKKGYTLPNPTMNNCDITRIINSDEVQNVVREKRRGSRKTGQKKNPLTNLNALLKLNPYAKTMKRKAFLFQEKRLAAKAATGKSGRAASFALARASEKKRNANAKAQSDKVAAITAKKAEITAGKAAKEQAKKDKKASK